MKQLSFLFIALIATAGLFSNTSCNNTNSKAKKLGDTIAQNMILIEGGTYTMGTDTIDYEEIHSDQAPAHQVTLKSFYICKYEVTQKEWEAIMKNNPSEFALNGPNNPVENVSWDDCQEFIQKLNETTGMKFRLPTEAEWEFAARGGNKSKGCRYSGNNDRYEVAVLYRDYDQGTDNVGTLLENELGLYDMSGNVYEFCQDFYGEYDAKSQTDPINTNKSVYHVARGGAWFSASYNCTVTNRVKMAKSERANGVGLRLAIDVEDMKDFIQNNNDKSA